MSTAPLGRLEPVPLRSVWASESSDFTPWLARAENIALLGETLQLDLEVEGEEQRVGPFRADILCKDTTTGRWVVIENQLNGTDHGHLGQILTYAAGLQATTVVWIAERFTDEHRAALDWLNQVTNEDVHFFGLEIEAWKIGGSPPAPKFNVVCQPNDWARIVTMTAQRVEAGTQSEKKQAYLALWQRFAERLKTVGSVLRPTKPNTVNFSLFPIGRSKFDLMATYNEGVLWANLRCTQPGLWPALTRIKDGIEQETGFPLEWDFKEGRVQNYVSVSAGEVDLDKPDTWPDALAELQSKLEKLHSVFAQRVKTLEPLP
jgi:hypothetical protein